MDLKKSLRHLPARDERIAALIARHGPPTFKRTRNSFQSLCTAIIHQQLTGKAAGTIYGRFLNLFPTGRFPKPVDLAGVPFERLRTVGLSRQKVSYLLDLAQKFSDGTIKPRRFSRMSDEGISTLLTQVKGIGQWSVDIFLISGLNRPDVLPLGDLGVRKGMQQHFGLRKLPDPQRMFDLAEIWRPYRSVASWYMWRLIDQQPARQ